tara:strand:+ start:8505 stop:9296 length:792 start_codon:yes stop_codon:yes gene_type:complete
MTRISLFSDLHLASNPEQRAHGQWPIGNLHSAVAAAKAFSPDRMVIAGDCAYKMGLPENYEGLATLLDDFRSSGVQATCLPGNHDHRENLRQVLGDPKTMVAGLLTAKVEVEQSIWLFLDTQLGLHEVRGGVGKRQRAWIERELDLAPEKPFIVVGHHHPENSVRCDTFPGIGLRDTGHWLRFLDAHSQIKAYVFGHTHSWFHEQTSGGTWLVNLPAVGFTFQEDRACGWAQAVQSPTELNLEFRSLDEKHPEHGDRIRIDLD